MENTSAPYLLRSLLPFAAKQPMVETCLDSYFSFALLGQAQI